MRSCCHLATAAAAAHLARALAHTGKHGETTVTLGHIVDQLQEVYRGWSEERLGLEQAEEEAPKRCSSDAQHRSRPEPSNSQPSAQPQAHLHDEHGLADASATKQANLATLLVGGQQIYDLQAGRRGRV